MDRSSTIRRYQDGRFVVDSDGSGAVHSAAVDAAERMAGITVESLIVSVTSWAFSSEFLFCQKHWFVWSRSVGLRYSKFFRPAVPHFSGVTSQGIHSLPIWFALDGQFGHDDPRGMIGKDLGSTCMW